VFGLLLLVVLLVVVVVVLGRAFFRVSDGTFELVWAVACEERR
jgi:hypothetical protein